MRNPNGVIALFVICVVIVFSSCNKENKSSDKDDLFKSEAAYEEADIVLSVNGKFEKVITKPLVKLDDCDFIVEGTIEFHKGDLLIAIVDFGDGTCDNIATKTIDGESVEFILKKKHKMGKYKKVIVEPLVKLDDCAFVVSGIIKFYEGEKWVATIDFGDGECDEWATKIWDGGSKVFSLNQ